jgi:predicted TIM-barrel fold metal-dependent hydrolase
VIDDMVVIDATTHAYNLADSNLVGTPAGPSRYAFVFREVLFGMHNRFMAEGQRVPRELFCTDWSPETLARTLFTESDVDLATHHRLRLDSLFTDGLCAHEKNVELAARWPHRFLTYAGVNPLDGVDACVADLRRQVADLPSTVGIKLYPDSGSPDRSWRLDDPQYEPLWAALTELGLRAVAVHKIVPNGLVPLQPYRIDDLEMLAIHHPELNFEIVHGGMPPFIDEVAMALMRLPNVYANLEITSALLTAGYGQVLDALAQFFGVAGSRKIIYSSGSMHFHPQPIIEFLARLSFPDHLLERYRIPQVTQADRAAILGGTYASMLGLDLGQIRAATAADDFAAARADGPAPMWSAWHEQAGLVRA